MISEDTYSDVGRYHLMSQQLNHTDTTFIFLQDCNNDGVTDCDDYARLHFHGREKCATNISNLYFGKRYESCKPVPSFPNGKQFLNTAT